MKISWGVGITISIIVFMLISFWLIYFSFSQDVNLVRDDYYEAEVQYNETMEKVKRTNQLTENLKVSVVNNSIELRFPKNFNYKNINGNIFLFRPSERNKDLTIPIQIDSNYFQAISTNNLLQGMWKIKIDWKADSVAYQNDEIIMIQ
ncbi:MAG: FixH family protein [Ignavibacteriae bacterium]|nr:FixH family protein [Ignavibacteriota bacterium]